MYHLPSSRASVLIFGINIAAPASACDGWRSARFSSAAWAAGAFAFLGLVDLERAAFEVLAVQRLDGAGRIGARQFDEAEAARAAGIAIHDQRDRLDRAVGREQRAHRGLGGGKG